MDCRSLEWVLSCGPAIQAELVRPASQSPRDDLTLNKKRGARPAKRLKALKTENVRLKKLLAESMLENEVTREALRKKW